MPRISPDAQRLSVKLGLGVLIDKPVCHGYRNGCVCHRCQVRAARAEAVVRLSVATVGPGLDVECEGGYCCSCPRCTAERVDVVAAKSQPLSLREDLAA